MDHENQGGQVDQGPAMTPQQRRLSSVEHGELAAYKQYVLGEGGWLDLVRYEFLTLMGGNLPGILGFGFRSLFYPSMFRSCEKGVVFGRSLVIRGAGHIQLGRKVLVDDFATLDARDGGALDIGAHVSIGRFSIVAAKGGAIRLGSGVNIGTNCRIATQSLIEIGESVLIAAYAYIGPGNHQIGDGETPLIERPMELRGGVRIGAHAWIGARATILDGVTIGERAVVGAHSLVREDVPPGAVVAGTPARIIGKSDLKVVSIEG